MRNAEWEKAPPLHGWGCLGLLKLNASLLQTMHPFDLKSKYEMRASYDPDITSRMQHLNDNNCLVSSSTAETHDIQVILHFSFNY